MSEDAPPRLLESSEGIRNLGYPAHKLSFRVVKNLCLAGNGTVKGFHGGESSTAKKSGAAIVVDLLNAYGFLEGANIGD